MINKEEIKNDFNETFSELETTIKGFKINKHH